ncbi:MAG: hypothetical protein IJM15_01715 [Erysipelotrichaceae bacterium]|nr:hypothetical protein [Erysipelotrichaceae bacterium]
MIHEVLSQLEKPSCSNSNAHFYNGYLRDYLESYEFSAEQFRPFFEELLKLEEDLMICADLPLEISSTVIANQIIRYKDAFKIPERYMLIPYILYWKKEEAERALLLSTSSYIEAKGLYYLLTEPVSEQKNKFDSCRNDIVASFLSEETVEDTVKVFSQMLEGKLTVGRIQRNCDRRYIIDVDEMKEKSVALAKGIFDDAMNRLPDLDDKADVIYTSVARVFLIKKALYVQYMMAKDILTTRHEGDVKKQRQFAKAYVDEVPIVSYSELWRAKREEPAEQAEEE